MGCKFGKGIYLNMTNFQTSPIVCRLKKKVILLNISQKNLTVHFWLFVSSHFPDSVNFDLKDPNTINFDLKDLPNLVHFDQTDTNPARLTSRIRIRFIWPQGAESGPFSISRIRILSKPDLCSVHVLFSWTTYLTPPPPPPDSPLGLSDTPPSTWINHSPFTLPIAGSEKELGGVHVCVWTVLTSQSITYLLHPPPNPSHPQLKFSGRC